MKKLAATVVILAVVALGGAASTATASTSWWGKAHYIIWHTFPAQTRAKAFRVAYCETGGFTDFYNEGSGAKGLFQEMAGNHNRVLYWKHHSLRIDYYKIKSNMPDWYAAKVALYQSNGGWNWSEWSCGYA